MILITGLGRSLAFLLLLAYPVTLVTIGIVYGGLAFWASFLASLALIVLLLSKLGYARNFEGRDKSLAQGLVGLTLGFLVSAGFYLGIIYAKSWSVPVIFGVLCLGLAWMALRSKF
jgi:hypothetical protein